MAFCEFPIAKRRILRQPFFMGDSSPDRLSTEIAEEILRRIFGDDFEGCTVSLDEIASMIQTGADQRGVPQKELLEMYDKAIEALHLLTKPPSAADVTDIAQLNALLSERLDAVQKLTKKVMETTALIQKGDST